MMSDVPNTFKMSYRKQMCLGLHAALIGHLVNVLITDYNTAELLLWAATETK